MIIKNVCLLLEALSVVICLHRLYGEKFKLDIVTVSFLSINMIIMTAMNYLGSSIYSMMIYPIIAVYCGMRFGFRWKEIVVNMVLCVILLGGLQIITLLLVNFDETASFANMQLLLADGITTMIVLFLLPMPKMRRLIYIIKDNGSILGLTAGTCFFMVLFLITSYKRYGTIVIEPIILSFLCFIFIFFLSGKLNKYKMRAKEIETELKMQKLYADSYQSLIDNIRLRQHEFNNHISMMHSLHLKYHTFEELADALENYGSAVMKENRFHKLLSCGNSVIIGFLYGRFTEFEKEGIDISYQVNMKELEIGIPIHKIVEILGDLMNNAVEALLVDEERRKLHVSVIESDRLYIEVRNESPYIPYEEIGIFFVKDYSKKGENRGLGLYNVKQICEEYGLEISCKNMDIDGENWLSFEICKEKETM